MSPVSYCLVLLGTAWVGLGPLSSPLWSVLGFLIGQFGNWVDEFAGSLFGGSPWHCCVPNGISRFGAVKRRLTKDWPKVDLVRDRGGESSSTSRSGTDVECHLRLGLMPVR